MVTYKTSCRSARNNSSGGSTSRYSNSSSQFCPKMYFFAKSPFHSCNGNRSSSSSGRGCGSNSSRSTGGLYLPVFSRSFFDSSNKPLIKRNKANFTPNSYNIE